MWRTWICGALIVAACGKGDRAKPAGLGSAAVVRADAGSAGEARGSATTNTAAAAGSLLDAAAERITGTKRPDITDLVALARAQAAWKRADDAKQTLASALERARADKTREGTLALLLGVDVLHALDDAAGAAKLREEALARLRAQAFPDEVLGLAFGPLATVESSETLRQLATIAAGLEPHQFPDVIKRVRPGTPAWDGLEAAVRSLAATPRANLLVQLAMRARRVGKPDVAKALITDPQARGGDDAVTYAHELIFAGDVASAKRAVAPLVKHAATAAPAERAQSYAMLALVHAHAGDAKASAGYEAKALAAAKGGGDALDEDDAFGGKVGDAVYVDLAAARLARGETDAGFAMVRERLRGEAPGEVAYVLAEYGKRDLAVRVLEGMKRGDPQRDAIADVVELDAERGKLDDAVELALEHRHGSPPGIDAILRAYAYAGDLAAVEKLAAHDRDAFGKLQLDAFQHVAAVTLAQRGDCTGARAAAEKVRVNSGACLAGVARHCAP